MHLVNYFLAGSKERDEKLEKVFELLGLGYRRKY